MIIVSEGMKIGSWFLFTIDWHCAALRGVLGKVTV
jgi:hypothetical protein